MDGQGDVDELHELIHKEEPYLLKGSPPCYRFSQLINIEFSSRDLKVVKEKKERAEGRLHTAIGCYWVQHRGGKYFLHEHPDGASSWYDGEMIALQRDDGVYIVEGPMCR